MSSVEETLSEAVRKYPVLYDKGSQDFKDRRKKKLAWDDVAKETGLKRKCVFYLQFIIQHKY